MSYERLNLQDGEKLKAEHIRHLEEGIENAGGKADLSVNDPEDPRYVAGRLAWKEEKQVPLDIQWDGNMDGRVQIPIPGFTFVKVSDLIITDEELRECFVYWDDVIWDHSTYLDDNFMAFGASMVTNTGIAIVRSTEDNFGTEDYPLYAPETGIYFSVKDIASSRYAWRLRSDTVTITEVVYHPVPMEYLPIVPMTRAEYDALAANGAVQESTLYVIVG